MLAQAVELRDEYTGGHTAAGDRLLAAARRGARAVGRTDLDLIRIGTPLHDIGKIGIDDAILRKPGKLTDAEFDDDEDAHDARGDEILQAIPDLQPIIPDRPQPPRALGRQAATRTGWPARRSRCWPGSWRWPTPSTR